MKAGQCQDVAGTGLGVDISQVLGQTTLVAQGHGSQHRVLLTLDAHTTVLIQQQLAPLPHSQPHTVCSPQAMKWQRHTLPVISTDQCLDAVALGEQPATGVEMAVDIYAIAVTGALQT